MSEKAVLVGEERFVLLYWLDETDGRYIEIDWAVPNRFGYGGSSRLNAQLEIAAMPDELARLQAENAELRAEVARLRTTKGRVYLQLKEERDEVWRLRRAILDAIAAKNRNGGRDVDTDALKEAIADD